MSATICDHCDEEMIDMLDGHSHWCEWCGTVLLYGVWIVPIRQRYNMGYPSRWPLSYVDKMIEEEERRLMRRL